jgi:hypothetical protein
LFKGAISNLYALVGSDPVNAVDPDGRFAVPLIVALPVIGGLVDGAFSALEAALCGGSAGDIGKAFGRGFVGGAVGTLTAIGVEALTGNLWLAGAASGEMSYLGERVLFGEEPDPVDAVVSTLGGAAGGAASGGYRLRGPKPGLLRPRRIGNPREWGKNSRRLAKREALGEAIRGTASAAASRCGCQ